MSPRSAGRCCRSDGLRSSSGIRSILPPTHASPPAPTESRRAAMPPNIARLPVLDYAARGFRPQKAELARLARFVRWIWQDYTKSLTAQGVIQMEARDLTRVSRLTTVRERNYWKLRYKLATASP